MKTSWFSLYNLILALWVGGIAAFTFIVTPVIFRSFGRDLAGKIVGELFPGYFLYNLVLAALALLLFFVVAGDPSKTAYRLSLFLLTAALIINVFIVFKLHPDTVKVKQAVTSFERESPDSPMRKRFAKLHALSAVLNLLLLADGVALLAIAPLLKR
jgi:hypothetical protein